MRLIKLTTTDPEGDVEVDVLDGSNVMAAMLARIRLRENAVGIDITSQELVSRLYAHAQNDEIDEFIAEWNALDELRFSVEAIDTDDLEVEMPVDLQVLKDILLP